MNYTDLKREYKATMEKIHQTDPRTNEWDRLWRYIDEIMYEWKHKDTTTA